MDVVIVLSGILTLGFISGLVVSILSITVDWVTERDLEKSVSENLSKFYILVVLCLLVSQPLFWYECIHNGIENRALETKKAYYEQSSGNFMFSDSTIEYIVKGYKDDK